MTPSGLSLTDGTVASPSGATTFQNLYEEPIIDAGLKTSDDVLVAMVRIFVNNRYEEVANWYPWRWLYELDYPQRTTAIYDTGTVEVTNGSTTVTGSGTAFTSAMTNRKIKISGFEEIYKITYVSATELTLNVAYTGDTESGASYDIYEDELSLPSDCQEIIAIRQARTPHKLEKITIRALRELYPAGYFSNTVNESRDPSRWCPIGIASDGDYRILLSPPPYREILLNIDYKKRITLLDHVDDEPLIPQQWRFILKAGVLADIYYRKRKDPKMGKVYEDRFYSLLKKMIAFNAKGDDRIRIIPNLKRRKYRRRNELVAYDTTGDYIKTL
ncbi:hypothetical protein KY345_04825 [Candidatus Woesearchaeota archaeon]|nr:hypothetical protein [Candidatus Woesearchaeota archaeon]